MREILLRNFELLDVDARTLRSGCRLLIRGDTIVRLDRTVAAAPGVEEIDLGGRVLMPGLIDCHVHINAWILPMHPVVLPSFMTAKAGATLKGMLMRGFTTVRDAGGADAGHRKAVEAGYFTGPRLLVSGRAISQTGGHGDPRSPADLVPVCGCSLLEAGMGRVADGVPEVRRAVRDEIRMGADQIKVMAGGGIASEADPIDQLQYSDEELAAICDEARRSHKYVMAHVFTTEGAERCIAAGVRSIEHGYLLDDAGMQALAASGTYLTPNISTPLIIVEEGVRNHYTAASMEKAAMVAGRVHELLELALRRGVKICFGSDMSRFQERAGEEFLNRSKVMPAWENIRSATAVAAQALRLPGRIGTIAEGAFADLLAVDGNPLEDIGLLAGQGEHFALIVKDGVVHKNTLA